MGATTSREQELPDGWKASLARSISAPTSRATVKNDSHTDDSWKSKFSLQSYWPRKSANSSRRTSKLKPLKEDETEVDFDDFPDAAEVDNNASSPSQQRKSWRFGRSNTFQSSSEMETKRSLEAPCRSFKAINGEHNTPKLSTRSGDLLDESIGLRLLLSSSSLSSHSQSEVSQSRGAILQKSASSRERSLPSYGKDLPVRSVPRVCMDDAFSLEPKWVAPSSIVTTGQEPLFDPSLLDTFEKAAEKVARSMQRASYTSNLESAVSSPGAFLQTNKSKQNGGSLARMNSLRSGAVITEKSNDNATSLTTFSFLNRKPSFSRVISLKNDKRDWSAETYLNKFLKMCPPGCEGKVVLYFTSLRGVRKTYENCFRVRLILQGLKIHVDERDVWMHSKFRQELTDVMGVALSVPRLFILGRYIGGADEVELLHEEGILAKLVEGLPKDGRQSCKVCADVRFIPCLVCSGSCKMVSSSGDIQRCTECNENGLIMCPVCT